MVYVLLLVLFLALLYLPQWWVQRVLEQHNQKPEANFPGSAAEFARHWLQRAGLHQVQVESTDQGDHYDPQSRTVRLTSDKFNARSLTAITVAAHECSHAMQHAAREPLFLWRTRLAKTAIIANRVGSFLLFAAPLLALITRAPVVMLMNLLGAFLVLGFGVVVQLITLPVELDASFNKALPVLKKGYLQPQQVPAAQQILRAAAWTYVAGSLASLLNFWRWLAVLRR